MRELLDWLMSRRTGQLWQLPYLALDCHRRVDDGSFNNDAAIPKVEALVPRKDVTPKGYVVILEDDAMIHELLERWLQEAGYVVAACAAASDVKPTLVIADIPEPQSGDALIRSLQQMYSAPILVLSARFRRGLAGSAEAALRLGVNKVLPKPFTRKELLAAVRKSVTT